ncbi:MAG: hypothetical protein K0R54_220 [Clostridiaceae bacterium]|jgi:hypothetical protein|nr:hypothetical protein [Clostridiaceae bacterium]
MKKSQEYLQSVSCDELHTIINSLIEDKETCNTVFF